MGLEHLFTMSMRRLEAHGNRRPSATAITFNDSIGLQTLLLEGTWLEPAQFDNHRVAGAAKSPRVLDLWWEDTYLFEVQTPFQTEFACITYAPHWFAVIKIEGANIPLHFSLFEMSADPDATIFVHRLSGEILFCFLDACFSHVQICFCMTPSLRPLSVTIMWSCFCCRLWAAWELSLYNDCKASDGESTSMLIYVYLYIYTYIYAEYRCISASKQSHPVYYIDCTH